ncbi:hypothetical protein CLF_109311, partial [Clonorchis sinensis]
LPCSCRFSDDHVYIGYSSPPMALSSFPTQNPLYSQSRQSRLYSDCNLMIMSDGMPPQMKTEVQNIDVQDSGRICVAAVAVLRVTPSVGHSWTSNEFFGWKSWFLPGKVFSASDVVDKNRWVYGGFIQSETTDRHEHVPRYFCKSTSDVLKVQTVICDRYAAQTAATSRHLLRANAILCSFHAIGNFMEVFNGIPLVFTQDKGSLSRCFKELEYVGSEITGQVKWVTANQVLQTGYCRSSKHALIHTAQNRIGVKCEITQSPRRVRTGGSVVRSVGWCTLETEISLRKEVRTKLIACNVPWKRSPSKASDSCVNDKCILLIANERGILEAASHFM